MIGEDYQALAAFRLEIRRFMDFSRQFLESRGVAPVQYQALLAVKAHEDRDYAIGDLAEELHIRAHSAVELVGRMQDVGLLERRRCPQDRRRILLALTPKAETLLPELAERHFAELHQKAGYFRAALARFDGVGEIEEAGISA